MTKHFFYLISTLRLHIRQNKLYCYTKITKETLDLLDTLWSQNLIWGYNLILNKYVKIYLRYVNNKPVISLLNIFKKHISIKKLRKNLKLHPQSFYLIKTSKGIKSQKYCLQHNISGLLILKIN